MVLNWTILFLLLVCTSSTDISSMVQIATRLSATNVSGADVFAGKMIQLRKETAGRNVPLLDEDPANIVALVLYSVQLLGHFFMFCPILDFLMWFAAGIPAYTKQYQHDWKYNEDVHSNEPADKSTTDGFSEAMSILTQQMTTIGYGSTTANKESVVNMAVHSLGSLIAQLGLGSWFKDLIDNIFDATKCHYQLTCTFVEFSVAFVLNIVMFVYDCPWGKEGCSPNGVDWMKAVYTVVISMTTVGYGDIAPAANLHKILSFFTQPWLGSSFDALNNFYLQWMFKKDTRIFFPRQSRFEWAVSQADTPENVVEPYSEDLVVTAGKAADKLPKKFVESAGKAADVVGEMRGKAANWVGDKFSKFRSTSTDTHKPDAGKELVVHNPWFNFDFEKLRTCKRMTRKEMTTTTTAPEDASSDLDTNAADNAIEAVSGAPDPTNAPMDESSVAE